MESVTIDYRDIDLDRLRVALAAPGTFQADKRERKWFALVSALPALLREVLLLELDAGNQLSTVQGGDWPMPGSVMVTLRKDFAADHTVSRPGLTMHHVNDPHYWMTDISQTVDGVEYFLAH